MTKISNLSRDASNEDNRYVNHLAFKYIHKSVVVAIKLPYFYRIIFPSLRNRLLSTADLSIFKCERTLKDSTIRFKSLHVQD